MNEFTDFLDKVRPVINNHMEQILNESGLEDDIIKMLLNGKRLRAGMLCAVFCSLGELRRTPAKLTDKVLDLSCAIELAHAASLIVDDMIDDDTIRRGDKTRHLLKGHKTAMLESIGLLSIPYDLASSHGKVFVKSLSQTQRHMVFGALKELFSSPDLPASKLHDIIITQKTGRLFALAAKWGAICATYPSTGDIVETYTQFGLHCGKAMQIADDIVDLNAITTGVKKSGFGSEVLLLNCIGIDGLIKDFIADFSRCDLDFSKISSSRVAIKIALNNKLYIAVDNAVGCVDDTASAGGKELLNDIPCTITKMMFDE